MILSDYHKGRLKAALRHRPGRQYVHRFHLRNGHFLAWCIGRFDPHATSMALPATVLVATQKERKTRQYKRGPMPFRHGWLERQSGNWCAHPGWAKGGALPVEY